MSDFLCLQGCSHISRCFGRAREASSAGQSKTEGTFLWSVLSLVGTMLAPYGSLVRRVHAGPFTVHPFDGVVVGEG